MIRLAKPNISDEEIRAVVQTLKSGNLTQGTLVKQFESAVAQYVGTKYAIAVSSGTAALHLALLALNLKKGDEVIIPDYTFPATANVIQLVGAQPYLVDIHLRTFNMDPDAIRNAITAKTKAIMPVHLFGQPAEMNTIMKIARQNRLYVIEDAACALGTEYEGIKCGAFGDVGCFSFHPRKIITTAEGGMVVTNNSHIAGQIRLLRNHGIKKNGFSGKLVNAGYNYRMSDVSAALGIAQMKKIDIIIQKHQAIAERYHRNLKRDRRFQLPHPEKKQRHTFQSYVILTKNMKTRNHLMRMLKKNGIESGIGTYALSAQKLYHHYTQRSPSLMNSQKAFTTGMALPLHADLKKYEVDTITQLILETKLS